MMNKKIFLNFGILSAFLFSGAANAGADLGVAVFEKSKYEEKDIIFASIEGIIKREFSPKFVQVESLKLIVNDSILGRLKKKEHIVCKIIPDIKMIAPFEEQVLDKTLNLSQGEEVLLYLGKNGQICEIVHLSKIANGIVHFPEYKKQKAMDIKKDEFKKYIVQMQK